MEQNTIVMLKVSVYFPVLKLALTPENLHIKPIKPPDDVSASLMAIFPT